MPNLTYDTIKKHSDKKLEEWAEEGTPFDQQYARLSGMLEMNVVTLLNYIYAYHGGTAYEEALTAISVKK